MKKPVIGFIILLSLSIFILPVAAHVPISAQDGETLETAYFIEDPTKSWVLYSNLHEGAEPQYFAFEIEAGIRIRMMLAIPVNADPYVFQPSIALMGPGLTNSSSIPSYLEIPESAGVMIFESESAMLAYEGFTPTSFYEMIQFEVLAPFTGEYYFAVYDPNEGGSFSVALGYVESFTLEEWLLVPFNVMVIHEWNGQSLLMILAPMIFTIILGVAYFLNRRHEFQALENPASWIGVVGALLFIGSGVTIFYQMIIAALASVSLQLIITFIFGLLPILLGYYTIRIVITESWHNQKDRRIRLLVLGLIAPFLWAGLLIGPALVILSSLLSSGIVFRKTSAIRDET